MKNDMAGRLDIDALRTLQAIASQGGVTRAAEHLNLSQSAVSHKIKRLEQSLDCTILTRRTGGPLLTQTGQRLIGYAERLLNLHDEAMADLVKKPINGTIRLGLTEDCATSDIATALGRFTRLYPNIDVRMRTAQSLRVQKMLDEGDLDLGIMQVFSTSVLPDDDVLFHDSLHWVKSPDLQIEHQGTIPFLAFDEDCFYRSWGQDFASRSGIRLKQVLECPSAMGIASAVRAGIGVALLNGLHVTNDMEILVGPFEAPPPLTFVTRKSAARASEPLRALRREITDQFATTPKAIA